MWKEVIKSGAKSVNRVLFKNITYDVMIEYIEENFTLDEPIGQYILDKEQIKLLGVQKLREMGKSSVMLTAYHSWFRNSFDKTVLPLLNKMVRLGVLEKTGRNRKDETGRSFYIFKRKSGVIKGKDYSKVRPNKISPKMEEDIEEVVADNEFENNPTLSDKIKHILMQPRKGKPAASKKDMRAFNEKYPNIKTNIPVEDDDIEDMDSGCGCGCDGKEVTKASSKCTKRTKKTSSKVKGKKWTQCVPTAEKGKFRRANWGQAGVKVTGDSGDTERKKTFRARHKCETCKLENGKKRYYSNQCLACRDW